MNPDKSPRNRDARSCVIRHAGCATWHRTSDVLLDGLRITANLLVFAALAVPPVDAAAQGDPVDQIKREAEKIFKGFRLPQLKPDQAPPASSPSGPNASKQQVPPTGPVRQSAEERALASLAEQKTDFEGTWLGRDPNGKDTGEVLKISGRTFSFQHPDDSRSSTKPSTFVFEVTSPLSFNSFLTPEDMERFGKNPNIGQHARGVARLTETGHLKLRGVLSKRSTHYIFSDADAMRARAAGLYPSPVMRDVLALPPLAGVQFELWECTAFPDKQFWQYKVRVQIAAAVPGDFDLSPGSSARKSQDVSNYFYDDFRGGDKATEIGRAALAVAMKQCPVIQTESFDMTVAIHRGRLPMRTHGSTQGTLERGIDLPRGEIAVSTGCNKDVFDCGVARLEGWRVYNYAMFASTDAGRREERDRQIVAANAQRASDNSSAKAGLLSKYGAVEVKDVVTLSRNPYSLDGRTVLVDAVFRQMIGPSEAMVDLAANAIGHGPSALVVGIPRGRIGELRRGWLVAKASGQAKRAEGAEPIPRLEFVDVFFPK